MKNTKFIVGIDEAGRGPLAGPVSIGLVMIKRTSLNKLNKFDDSKRVSPIKREEFYGELLNLDKKREIYMTSTLVGKKIIDREGIGKAIQIGIYRVFRRVEKNPENIEVLLDGLLSAPKEYKNQKTIKGGDRKEKIIGAASIVAKVRRDKYMKRKAEVYPEYNFHKHMGYGTKEHRKLIKKHGVSEIHRKTFNVDKH